MTPAQHQATSPSKALAETTDLIRDVFDAELQEHLDSESLEEVLASLLAMYPEAPVAAHRTDGIIVDVPDSVPLKRNPVLKARSGLDLINHDDDVLNGWGRVIAEGAARYPVHLVGRPEVQGVVYGLDLRELHGIVLTLSVFALAVAPDGTYASPELPEIAPRFATLRKDEQGFIVAVDEALTKILGWSADEMVGRRSTELIHPDDHELAIDNWMELLAHPGPGRRVRLRHLRKDGSWVWLEATNHNLFDDPEYGCVVSEMVDISEEMAAHELLDRLAQAVPVGLFQVDAERRVVYTNDRLHEILGLARADTFHEQLATIADADLSALEGALDQVLGEGVQADVEGELCLPESREVRFCAISLRALGQAEGTITGAIACVSDITDSAKMREELKRRATFDEPTGCYNRATIMRALEANIASGQRQAERAVMFVDLDRFKAVNDRHGHAAGDELLSEVAQRLRGVVRSEDMVGRIGGDEFLVLCPDIGGPEHAMKLAERVTEAMREQIAVTPASIVQLVSVGVAWSHGEEADADTIVAEADDAMYESKREGAGRPKFARRSSMAPSSR